MKQFVLMPKPLQDHLSSTGKSEGIYLECTHWHMSPYLYWNGPVEQLGLGGSHCSYDAAALVLNQIWNTVGRPTPKLAHLTRAPAEERVGSPAQRTRRAVLPTLKSTGALRGPLTDRPPRPTQTHHHPEQTGAKVLFRTWALGTFSGDGYSDAFYDP